MKSQRRLVLKKETLAELSTTELRDIAAGQQALTPNCPTNYCASGHLDCITTWNKITAAIDPCLTGLNVC
jgi:hypothetical protein